MKQKHNKAALLTLYGNTNYGNKLQNYATQEILHNYFNQVITIKNKNNKNYVIFYMKNFSKYILSIFCKKYRKNYNIFTIYNQYKRLKNFKDFNKLIEKNNWIEYTDRPSKKLYDSFDYFIVGSDQVWNPGISDNVLPLFILKDCPKNKKKISFSSSISINQFTKSQKDSVKSALKKFDSISVREEQAKIILEDCTGRKDIEVLMDPTMILDENNWNEICTEPKQLKKYNISKKFILNYFLGEMSNEQRKNIDDFAKKHNCTVINLLESTDPFYECGPSEFIWLEKNAFLICTDSFHSSVFAIIYKKPFIVFDRQDKLNRSNSMNSRLETLLSKFNLQDRYYHGIITDDFLNCDFSCNESILFKERKKAYNFLDKAFYRK